jgi:anti-sigma factor RsiW
MNSTDEQTDLSAELAALADGIIPADDRDEGARCVDAGAKLAARVAAGVNAATYRAGVKTATALAREQFAQPLPSLDATQMHALIGRLKSESPAFYKQLRMDVSALYLSNPAIWQRIGFPGPSTAAGGYPDFDQPQS